MVLVSILPQSVGFEDTPVLINLGVSLEFRRGSFVIALTSHFLFLTRDNFGFITYRYTCDAFAALENGHTLRRSNEPQFELCFGGQKQFSKSHYTDLGE